MVFETVVASVVNQILGEYIDNLEAGQLSLGVWSGDVALHGLKLRKDALAKLKLPIEILDGTLGDLTLSIPWSDLKNKPLKLAINNLHILALPKASAEYDPVDEDERSQAAKKQKLAAAEQMALRAKSSSPAEESSFFAQLSTKLIDNLQLSITNIHIRYEDPSVSTKIPFSVGITLAGLSAVSTDESWKEGFIQAEHDCIYKLLRLSQLGIYWTTSSSSYANEKDKAAVFSEAIVRDFKVDPARQYILNPVSGEGRLTWQKSLKLNKPKTDLNLTFNEFSFSLDDEQYSTFIALFGAFSRYIRAYPYRKFHPPRSITPKLDPKAWFKFAGKCVLHDIHEARRKWSWDYFRERRNLRLEYIAYYMQLKGGTLDHEGKVELDELERLLSFDDIRLYRHLATNNLKKKLSKKTDGTLNVSPSSQPPAQTWIGWLAGGTPTSPSPGSNALIPSPGTQGIPEKDSSQAASASSALTPAQAKSPSKIKPDKQTRTEPSIITTADLRQLYDAIEFDPNSVSTVETPPEYVVLQVHTKLQFGSLTLRRNPKAKSSDLFVATFEKMTFDLKKHKEAMETYMALENVVVVEKVHNRSLHPVLIRAKSHQESPIMASKSDTPFFSVHYEHKPLSGVADDILKIKMLPLEIVVNPFALRTLFDFFSPDKDEYEAISTLQAVAQDAIQGVAAQTRASIEFALEEHAVLDMHIEVDAPIFVIPSSFTDPEAPGLIVDAGHLEIQSNPIRAATKELLLADPNARHVDLEKLAYDTYIIKLTSVQAIVCQRVADYKTATASIGDLTQDSGSSCISLIEKVDVIFNAKVSILPKALEFAKFKIDGQLPRLHVNFSDYSYLVIFSIMESTSRAFAIAPTNVVPKQHAVYNNDMAIRSRDWYRSFADNQSPLMFSENESKDEFHDAVESVAETLGHAAREASASRQVLHFVFQCQHLSMSIQSVAPLGDGKPLGTKTLALLAMRGLRMTMTQRPYDIVASCHLESFAVEDSQLPPDDPYHRLIGPTNRDVPQTDDGQGAEGRSLVSIQLRNMRPLSPDFSGTGQSLEISLDSTRFVISREWILDINRFFTRLAQRPPLQRMPSGQSFKPVTGQLGQAGMAAFASNTSFTSSAAPSQQHQPQTSPVVSTASAPQSYCFIVKIKSVKVLAVKSHNQCIASSEFNNLVVETRTTGSRMTIKGTLGRLSIIDELSPEHLQLMRNFIVFEDDQTANFLFELLDAREALRAGYNSFLKLRAASARITYNELFFSRLYDYFSRFQEMRALVETARKVAEESALQMQQQAGKFLFDIVLQTPIIVWPRSSSLDRMIFYLGEISARNGAKDKPFSDGAVIPDEQYRIDLESMRAVSVFAQSQDDVYPIIENVNLGITIAFYSAQSPALPQKHIAIAVSQITIRASEDQYQLFVDLWRAFNSPSSAATVATTATTIAPAVPPVANTGANLGPGTASTAAATAPTSPSSLQRPINRSKLQEILTYAEVTLPSIVLEVYTGEAREAAKSDNTALAQFAGIDASIKLQLKETSTEMEWRFRGLSVYDTRANRQTHFRDILVPTNETDDQFVLHYSSTPTSSRYTVTVDHPKLILELDYIFAIRALFSRPWSTPPGDSPATATSDPSGGDGGKPKDKGKGKSKNHSSAASGDMDDDWAISPEPSTFTYRINFVDPEIALVRNPERADTEAVVLMTDQLVIAFDQLFLVSFRSLEMYFCIMDAREKTQLRFVESFDVSLSLDSRQTAPSHFLTNATLALSFVVLRVSYRDMVLIWELYNRVLGFMRVEPPPVEATPQQGEQEEQQQSLQSLRPVDVYRQRFRLVVEGLRAVIIDDVDDFHVPMFDLVYEKFVFEVADWSSQLRFDTTIALHANYFNLKNSHWEPLVEQWQFSVSASHQSEDAGSFSVDVFCRKKLELNLSHAFIETALMAWLALDSTSTRYSSKPDEKTPYVLKNRTGYSLHVWIDSDAANANTKIFKIENGKDLGWRFSDWRAVRERTNPTSNRLCVQLHGPPWETLKGVTVDSEGTSMHALRPSIERIHYRLVCQVELKDRIKVVTLRSSTVICNKTAIPVEIIVVPRRRQATGSGIFIAPGDSYAIPIEASYSDAIYVRPFNFGYEWCGQQIFWKDLKADQPASLVTCKSRDASIPVFRFQINTVVHDPENDSYPNLDIVLTAPFTIENLLPNDINYVVFDKATRQELRGSLKTGASDPLHTLDPTHLLALNIHVVGADLRQKEVMIITSTELQYRDDILVLYDQAGHQLNLKLKYYDASESTGRGVSIYSPYVLLNRTAREMYFSARSLITTTRIVGGQTARGRNDPSAEPEPIMFSYSTFEPLRSRAQVKLEDSDWSKPLSFEAVGSAFEVKIPNSAHKTEAHLGVDIKDGEGKFRLTKVVTFSPRFIIRNIMGEPVYFRQDLRSAATMVSPKSNVPLIMLKAAEGNAFELSLRLSSPSSIWSNPFSITQLGTVFVKITRSGSNIEDLIRAEIVMDKATLHITLSRQEGRWPLRIENQADVDVSLWQLYAPTRYVISRKSSLNYAWDHPSTDHKRLVLQVNGKEHIVDASYLGQQKPLKYPVSGSRRTALLSIELVADGPTTVLKLKSYTRADRHGADSLASLHTDISDTIAKDAKILQTVHVRMEGIGISLVSRKTQEIAYASAKSLVFMWTETEDDHALSFSIKWLQIDNQMFGSLEPIFLYPTVLPNESKEDFHPVLMMSLCKSKDSSYGVEYFKWFTLLLQELSVDLDEEFLYALTDFLRFGNTSTALASPEAQAIATFGASQPSAVIGRQADSDNLFFEKFLLHPVQINMSFARSPGQSADNDTKAAGSSGVMSFVLEVLTMTIGNIHDAPIRLNALELEHPIVSFSQLSELIMRFYSQEILGQVHRIIGAADFLGNPVGLFNNVASGVSDMFYEPLQGFEITRPQDFGLGVARGASSLVKKTVFGLTDTLSKFTGSIGKGLSVMTMDEAFQEKRRLASRNRPRHVMYGMTSGAASLLRSVTSGVTGVVSQPIKGAQESGFEGFFKGLGKGLVGAVAKPIVGLVDLTTSVSEGIKNTTTVFDSDLDRQRLPRFVGKDKILKPYDHREALGQSWLETLENGRYFRENYVAHLEIRVEDLVAIITNSRVFMARMKKLKLEWDLPFEDLQVIRAETGGLALLPKFRHTAQIRMIPCPDRTSMEWFRNKLEGAFMDYLQQTKLFE